MARLRCNKEPECDHLVPLSMKLRQGFHAVLDTTTSKTFATILPLLCHAGAADTETTERMMRAAHYLCGLFEIKEGPDGSPMYQNNAFSAVLSDRHPNSVRAAAIHFSWDCWRWVPAGDSALLSASAAALADAGLWRSNTLNRG